MPPRYFCHENLRNGLNFAFSKWRGSIFLKCRVPLSDSWVCALFRHHWDQIREAPRHISIPSSQGMPLLLERSGFKNIRSKPASILQLAGDIAFTLWTRGNFFMTTGKWAFLKILDRMIVGFLTILGIPLVALLKTLGVKQVLTVFLAQKAA